MRCAIFYSDGTVYEGDGLDAPPLDVQAIVYNDPSDDVHSCGRIVLKGWDYYLLETSWVGVNGAVDLVDHVLHRCPQKVLKGRMIPKNEWHDVIRKASNWPGFKRRSAKARGFEEPLGG